jgi:DNA-binding transcriptional LysR family regulator
MDVRLAEAGRADTVAAMELRHLRYFVAVAEELHFRRAADRLHIAQPAVSEQIRNLERELGVQLLERTPPSVVLTPPGAVLLEEARRVLRIADDARRATRQAQAGILARVRVRVARPRDVLPAPVTGLTVTPFAEEGVVVALPDAHPGAGQDAFPIEQLDGSAPIMLPREVDPPFYDAILGAARDASITLHPRHTPAPTVEQALVAVASGRAPALLPASVAERHVFGGLRFLPLAEPVPRTTVALVSPRSMDRLHAVRFIRLVAAMSRPLADVSRPALSRAA